MIGSFAVDLRYINIPQIAVLRVLIPVNEYHEAKERYAQAKERQRRLHARVAELRDKNAPVHAKREWVLIPFVVTRLFNA